MVNITTLISILLIIIIIFFMFYPSNMKEIENVKVVVNEEEKETISINKLKEQINKIDNLDIKKPENIIILNKVILTLQRSINNLPNAKINENIYNAIEIINKQNKIIENNNDLIPTIQLLILTLGNLQKTNNLDYSNKIKELQSYIDNPNKIEIKNNLLSLMKTLSDDLKSLSEKNITLIKDELQKNINSIDKIITSTTLDATTIKSILLPIIQTSIISIDKATSAPTSAPTSSQAPTSAPTSTPTSAPTSASVVIDKATPTENAITETNKKNIQYALQSIDDITNQDIDDIKNIIIPSIQTSIRLTLIDIKDQKIKDDIQKRMDEINKMLDSKTDIDQIKNVLIPSLKTTLNSLKTKITDNIKVQESGVKQKIYTYIEEEEIQEPEYKPYREYKIISDYLNFDNE